MTAKTTDRSVVEQSQVKSFGIDGLLPSLNRRQPVIRQNVDFHRHASTLAANVRVPGQPIKLWAAEAAPQSRNDLADLFRRLKGKTTGGRAE